MSTVRDRTSAREEKDPLEGGPSALALALRGYQSALDEFDEAIAALMGVNRTDLRCIDLLSLLQPMSAGQLAHAAGLTSGAMTFVLDRLERAGFVSRRRDEHDRRRVLVELVPEAARRGLEIHLPLVRAMRRSVSSFNREEVAAVERFFVIGRELYREHARRLRDARVRAAELPD